jgi:uncharacterized protein YbjT (DUF2867 family)
VRVLLIGATGLTGQQVLARARHRRIEVTAVVRPGSTSRVTRWSTDVPVVVADPLDPDALAPHVPGHDVVVCAVGQHRRTRSPWSRLVSPADTITRAATALAAVADRDDVRAGVLVSANGVADSRDQTSTTFQRLVDHSNLRHAFADSAAAERVVQAARTPWVVLRPTLLGGRAERWQELDRVAGLRTTISRRGVADAILDVAASTATHPATMSITAARPG